MATSFDYPAYPYVRSADQDAAEPVHHPVIVVGAGMVGLTFAVDMAVRGQPVLVLDEDDKVSVGSRAICVAKRSIEIFDRLGIGQRCVDKGVTWHTGKVLYGDELVYEFDLLPETGHQRPAFINLQQYYVETYLIERHQELGVGALRWRNKVVHVEQHDDHVALDIETPDGPYRLTCDWLIAADGVRSVVRHQLDLPFVGETFHDHFLITDVIMKSAFPNERRFWFDPTFHQGGSALLHKQPDDMWRIDLQLGPEADRTEELKEERILPRLYAMLGDDAEFTIDWSSIYTFQCRRLEKFRHGRIFYRGEIADKIIKHLQQTGGIITAEDLANFEPEWQAPIYTTYRDYKIYAPPLPCQGVQFLETLNIMEGYDVAGMGHNTAATLHRFIEAAKLATADRAEFVGLENPPAAGLIAKGFAAQRREAIGPTARPSGGERYTAQKMKGEVLAGDPTAWMTSECTTHFDAIDAEGNAVAVTQSLGDGFGSAVVIPETGIALNDFIGWLDREPTSPNAIGPAKKMEMCMSPAQVWDKNGLRLLIGTPGSYGILQTTPQMIMNVLDHKLNIQAAIEAARLTATNPGRLVNVETRIPDAVLIELEQMGHQFNRLGDWSAAVGGGQGIEIDPETGSFMGGADPRRDGYVIGW